MPNPFCLNCRTDNVTLYCVACFHVSVSDPCLHDATTMLAKAARGILQFDTPNSCGHKVWPYQLEARQLAVRREFRHP